jgi:hypothetical protein
MNMEDLLRVIVWWVAILALTWYVAHEFNLSWGGTVVVCLIYRILRPN